MANKRAMIRVGWDETSGAGTDEILMDCTSTRDHQGPPGTTTTTTRSPRALSLPSVQCQPCPYLLLFLIGPLIVYYLRPTAHLSEPLAFTAGKLVAMRPLQYLPHPHK